MTYDQQVQALKPGSDESSRDPGDVHEAASRGIEGPGTRIPHLDKIQDSFGSHDVSGAKAHVGGDATKATQRMGASAYTSGNDVAFGQPPDLHTAAHEATHVVQ